MQKLVIIVLLTLILVMVAYIYNLKKNMVKLKEVNDAPPFPDDNRRKYNKEVLPEKGIPGRRGEWLRPVSAFDDKGLYTGYDIFPDFVDSVYMLDVAWVNSVATTSYKHFKDKDVDNATIVVLCNKVDIHKDKFRLFVKEPHGEYWTEFIDMDYMNRNGKRIADDMALYTKKTLIIDGYVREGKFFVEDITAMLINKNIFDRD